MRLCMLVLGVFNVSLISGYGTLGADVAAQGTVYVDGKSAIGRTDSDFICATLDWWPPEKCDYGTCAWGHASLLNLVCLLCKYWHSCQIQPSGYNAHLVKFTSHYPFWYKNVSSFRFELQMLLIRQKTSLFPSLLNVTCFPFSSVLNLLFFLCKYYGIIFRPKGFDDTLYTHISICLCFYFQSKYLFFLCYICFLFVVLL